MDPGKDKWSLAGKWYAAGLFLAYVLILFSHASPPSLTDYGNWTYQGILLRNHLLGTPDPAHVLKHYPVPNSAATLAIGILALVLPWAMAAKAWLACQLLISLLAVKYMLNTTGASPAAWVIVPQAVFLNVSFWYGFVNFELGLAWVFVMAALLLRQVRGQEPRSWRLGALLLLAFFTHMIPFAFCGLMLILYVLQTRRYKALWQLLPAVAATAWYVCGRYLLAEDADGKAGMVSTFLSYTRMFWVFKGNSYLKSLGFVDPMGRNAEVFGRWGLWALLGMNLVFGLVAGAALLREARQRLGGGVEDRFLWIGLVMLVPVFLLTPGAALGISDPGARTLQVALALGLALCWNHARRWERRLASTCAAVLAAAGLYLFLLCGSLHGTQRVAPVSEITGASRFAFVPNEDQVYFYLALNRGEMKLSVFPTGMFLNSK